MDVALITEQLLAPVPGGTGRYTAELLDALRRTGTGGDTVTSWTAWHRDGTIARTTAGSMPTHRLPLGQRSLAAAWARGLGPVPTGDVAHAPTPLFPPRRRRPVVVTVHDAVPYTHPQTLTAHGARWHRRMIERAARHADAVTVPTAAVAAALAETVPGWRPERVHVLGAGVARALLAEPDAGRSSAVRRRLDLPERYLITVATLEPRKGLDTALAALARWPQAPPLLVVGAAGWGGVDVAGAARTAGLREGAVRALGRIPDADLAVVLRGATALVAPSRAEGFGLPLVEAMALGVAVVASDIPPFREVAGDAAVLVPVADAGALADALAHVVADEGARAGLVSAGHARAADFDWDIVAARAWQLYRTVASASRQ
jgi:glycosyltransferase involved in cell wall biosynthesis